MDYKAILKEFQFDIESAERIVKVIYENPISLSMCADILEYLVPYINLLTYDGVLRVLKVLNSGIDLQLKSVDNKETSCEY